jgi:hypothetical protein
VKFSSEADLAKHVVAWLKLQEWDVYQEVRIEYGGSVADIVAVKAGRVWVVETKRALSFDLLAQAYEWRGVAHWSSAAAPYSRNFKARAFVVGVARIFGLGLLYVRVDGDVEAIAPPAINRHARAAELLGALNEGHRSTAAAGSAGGGYWTPFRNTCSLLKTYVSENPGCSLRDAIQSIDHHYRKDSTAISSLRAWLQAGKVKGVEVRADGRFIKLYPRQVEACPP